MEKIEKCEREMGKIDELWAGRKIYRELAKMGWIREISAVEELEMRLKVEENEGRIWKRDGIIYAMIDGGKVKALTVTKVE